MMLDWNTLDPDEQRVMGSGIERHELGSLYMYSVSDRDADYPNRGYRYVPPLMEAAKRLIGRGLIAIVPDGVPGPPQELSTLEAVEVVSDINNWWRYHPEDSADDDEDDGVNPIVGGLPPTNESPYLVTDTHHGEYTIVNWEYKIVYWEPPKLMDPR